MDRQLSAEKSGHRSQENMQEDMNAAHAAWAAWKSDDPSAIEFAVTEKERLLRKNPQAWEKAMREIEEEKERKALTIESTPPLEGHRQKAMRPNHRDGSRQLHSEYLNSQPPPPKRVEHMDTVTHRLHAGYAPETKFAPPPPASPAYDAAFNRPEPEFYGVDLGLLRLGVNSNGSLDLGVNVGLASTRVQVGLENRVDAEFMPIGGPLHARTGASIGINRDGLHSEVGAGANFFNLVNGDADFGARLGQNSGVAGDVRGQVWPVNVQADAGAGVGPEGINAYTGANTGIGGGNTGLPEAFKFRTGGHFDLNRNSGVGAGVGVGAGGKTIDFGPSIETYGNRTVSPETHLGLRNSSAGTFYPTGDRVTDSGDENF